MELASSEMTQVDPESEAWFASYAEPATEAAIRQRVRLRRARGRGQSRRPAHLRHRRRQNQMMVASLLFVGLMTACFYFLLSQ